MQIANTLENIVIIPKILYIWQTLIFTVWLVIKEHIQMINH